MKTILGLVAIIGIALALEQAELANMEYFLHENARGEIRLENLTGVPDLRNSASDLTFHFFSRTNPTNPVLAYVNDVSSLRNSAFNKDKDTTVIVHGWESQAEAEINFHITEYTLKAHDVNVFVCDWSPIAEKNYISAQGSVRNVGEYLAAFIQNLISTYGLQLSKLKFVGHSLGAHIVGCAGAALNGQVEAIVGLDSAGPLFSTSNIANRLDPTDAKFVQAIHTNGGRLGFSSSHGHVDMYPNGGRSQPGCGVDLFGACAHSRVYSLYAESMISNGFVARLCGSYSQFTSGMCSTTATSILGTFKVDTSARGDYYLTTNGASPFAQG